MSRKKRIISKLSSLLESISGLAVDPQETDVTFLEWGFDSLFFTQASLSLKSEFGVNLSFRQLLDEYTTLDTLAAFIDSQLPAAAFSADASASLAGQVAPANVPLPIPALPVQVGTSAKQSAVERLVANQPPSAGLRLDRDERGNVVWVETDFEQDVILLVRPITESQKEVWLWAQMGDEANCAFNQSMSLRLMGDLDVAALKTAVFNLTQRHEALRLTFTPDGETMVVAHTVHLDIPYIDLSAKTPAERESALRNVVEAEVTTPFDLTFGPLLRAKLVKLTGEEQRLLITFHHIIADDCSIATLLSDLGQLYQTTAQQAPTNLPAPFKYSWYARYLETKQVTEAQNEAEIYWLKQFADSIPFMDLPTDRPRPKARSYKAAREDILLDAHLIKALKKLGAQSGFTFFMILFAAFNLYLSKLLDQDDLVVGVPAAGQSLVGEETLIGHCVNMLPIRTQLTSDMGLMAYLQHVKEIVLDAHDHQDYTFGSLLNKLPLTRDASRIPLIPITFNIDQELRKPDYGNLHASYFSNPRRAENFELAVNCYESPDGLMVEMSYNTDLFDQATILQRVAEFKTLIEQMIAHPDKSLAEYTIVPDEMRQTLLQRWNETQMDYPQQATVPELIAAQAETHPERVAVVAGRTEMTYGELNGRSNQLARHLQSLGVKPDALVAVSLERTTDLLVATLAIWKAGGAYVPLDPAYPPERLALMLIDSGASVLVTQSSLQAFLPEHMGDVVLLDEEWSHIETLSNEPLPVVATPAHLAYVIYTSGSTGKPKGVQVPHGAVVNFLVSMGRTPGLTADDTLLAVTTLSFDIHVLELYLPLLQGARIILASQAEAADGEALLRLIQAHHVTVMQATPVSWRLLLAAGWSQQDALKVLVGGEALPPDLARELLLRGESVWNMYGPTETTVWSTCYQVTDPDAPILIGKPIGNTQVYVLNQAQQLTPIGVPGELYIGGAGLARGYLGRPDLTQERFVPNPFSSQSESRLYRTGDLVRYLPDGNLEYFRRLDNQVKVRGFRIELGDVEAAMRQFSGVAQAVATVRDDMPGGKALVGYLVPAPDDTRATEGSQETESKRTMITELRQYLRGKLPEYMVPSRFVIIDTLPLTPNGKIDRQALPKPTDVQADTEAAYTPPRSELETAVARIWADVLDLSQLGIHDNFFELGGHSLIAIQIVMRINKAFNIELPMGSLFQMPTVAILAQDIAARQYLIESEALLDATADTEQEEFVF